MRAGMLLTCLLLISQSIYADLPDNFVYLDEIAPSIKTDIRYAGTHNFIGRPLAGYESERCILTRQAARQLLQAQQELLAIGYGLKVYDCYRPKQAIEDMVAWSKTKDQSMKKEFYPLLKKTELVKYNFIDANSTHNKGGAIDLTIVPINSLNQQSYSAGQALVECFENKHNRYFDNSIDMGTGYNCFHPAAHIKYKKLSLAVLENRLILRQLLERHNFKASDKEWWHFEYKQPQEDVTEGLNFAVR